MSPHVTVMKDHADTESAIIRRLAADRSMESQLSSTTKLWSENFDIPVVVIKSG